MEAEGKLQLYHPKQGLRFQAADRCLGNDIIKAASFYAGRVGYIFEYEED